MLEVSVAAEDEDAADVGVTGDVQVLGVQGLRLSAFSMVFVPNVSVIAG